MISTMFWLQGITWMMKLQHYLVTRFIGLENFFFVRVLCWRQMADWSAKQNLYADFMKNALIQPDRHQFIINNSLTSWNIIIRVKNFAFMSIFLKQKKMGSFLH